MPENKALIQVRSESLAFLPGGVAINAVLEFDEISRQDFVAGIYPAYRKVTPIPEEVPPLFLMIAGNCYKVELLYT